MIKKNKINELSVSLNGLGEPNCWLFIHKLNSGSDQLKQSGQNDKEGGGRCFSIQNNTWLNKIPAPEKQHACNDSIPERKVMDPTSLSVVSVVKIYTEVISGSK